MLEKNIIQKYDYEYPSYLIAKYPPYKRGYSNVLIYYTQTGKIVFTKYNQLYKYILPKTLIVRNITKVFKARLYVKLEQNYRDLGQNLSKKATIQKFELLLLSVKGISLQEFIKKHIRKDCIEVEVLARIPKKYRDSSFVIRNWRVTVKPSKDHFIARFCFAKGKLNKKELVSNFLELLALEGNVPIPPYLKRQAKDLDNIRYQTIFGKVTGSVAAPTASLNFTKGLKNRLSLKNVEFASVVLHVGLGTFAPLREENLKQNKLHEEFVYVDKNNLNKIRQAKLNDNPIMAVGTTVVRTLETIGKNLDLLNPNTIIDSEFVTTTDLFIRPPFEFSLVDMLLTNFHFPKTSLLMLVDAFLQYKGAKHTWKQLYELAVYKKFKLYSYGDSMLII